MTRSITGLLALALVVLAGCSGSSGLAPGGNDGGNGGTNNGPLFSLARPEAIYGDHSVSTIPGRLSILTGATRAEVQSMLAGYGWDLLSFSSGRALIGLPLDADLNSAATALTKEFLVIRAEPSTRINTAQVVYDSPALSRGASLTPFDPYYGETTNPLFNNGAWTVNVALPGQAQPMNMMGFNTAWDVALTPAVAAEPVVVAVIDAGGFDYSTPGLRADFDDSLLDAANSGFIASDGTFTAGLAAATWEIDDDGDPGTRDFPFRPTGEVMLGMLAANIGMTRIQAVDLDGSTTLEPDTEIWNEGIAGINPTASIIFIKTGELSGSNWTFPDTSIEHSINHAVSAGANIVLLGMFGNGAVSGGISAAVQNARDNDVLVIAPAGDVVDTYDGGSGTFTGTPVDIGATPVTPASDPNVVSVTATGFDRAGDLGTIDFDPPGPGPEDLPNVGNGFNPHYEDAIGDSFRDVASYCNTGAAIAAVGYGIGFSFHPYLQAGDGSGDPFVIIPGENYNFSLSALGTSVAAAYVAGAASQVFQILSNVNGTPPTDDEVLAELLSTAQKFGGSGITGVDDPSTPGPDDGGLLNAGFAAASALNGGNIINTLPALQFSSVLLSQALDAVTRGTDISVTATVVNGTAPFELTMDWGDGNPPVVVSGWNNGDPLTLTGGYDVLGPKALNVTVTDADSLTVGLGAALYVINPLSCNISISDAQGLAVLPTAVISATNYRFSANATNVFTGEIGGTPNLTTFNWNMDADAAYEATGPNPTFAFPTTGSFTVTLDVTEDVRPDSQFTLAVTVIPPS